MISVLLADDHALVRKGFRRMLEDEPDIQVVEESSDGAAAVEAVLRLRPNVAVLDFAMPNMNGAAATRVISKQCPETSVLILSMHSETTYVTACLDAGARGYLLKNAMDLELVDAIRQIAAGAQVIDPKLKEALASSGSRPSLTPRELEVLQWIVLGKSNKDIAVLLSVSVNTVSVHRANIMQGLDIHNTAELVVYAIREGLVSIA